MEACAWFGVLLHVLPLHARHRCLGCPRPDLFHDALLTICVPRAFCCFSRIVLQLRMHSLILRLQAALAFVRVLAFCTICSCTLCCSRFVQEGLPFRSAWHAWSARPVSEPSPCTSEGKPSGSAMPARPKVAWAQQPTLNALPQTSATFALDRYMGANRCLSKVELILK